MDFDKEISIVPEDLIPTLTDTEDNIVNKYLSIYNELQSSPDDAIITIFEEQCIKQSLCALGIMTHTSLYWHKASSACFTHYMIEPNVAHPNKIIY